VGRSTVARLARRHGRQTASLCSPRWLRGRSIRAVSIAVAHSNTVAWSTHRAVVPDGKAVLAPFESYLQVMVLVDDAVEVAQDHVRLVLRNTDDATSECWIDIQPLPACDWVGSNDFCESVRAQNYSSVSH
jgi:hypothetical protein